ncbi:MAG: hypothetical protein K0R73_955, partial [Candidatus Midichloriaceae bacterium]|nr:hypothetical protein [Candidatus Midichloriaceae bacterium]
MALFSLWCELKTVFYKKFNAHLPNEVSLSFLQEGLDKLQKEQNTQNTLQEAQNTANPEPLKNQIAFYENAIKICEAAKEFVEKTAGIVDGDDFKENYRNMSEGFNEFKDERIKFVTNKATAQICGYYALMLAAAAAFVIAISPLIAPTLMARRDCYNCNSWHSTNGWGCLMPFYVVMWDGKTPSPLGEYFSIIGRQVSIKEKDGV